MNNDVKTPRTMRIFMIIAVALTAVWLLLEIALFLFQDTAINIFSSGVELEYTEKIVCFTVIPKIVSAVFVAVSAERVINGKGTVLPLILSVLATAFTPISNAVFNTVQNIYMAHLGSAALVKYASILNVLESWLYYVLYFGMIISLAVSAAYYVYTKLNKNNKGELIQ